jgi:hypothetical protein
MKEKILKKKWYSNQGSIFQIFILKVGRIFQKEKKI